MKKIITYIRETYYINAILVLVLCVTVLSASLVGIKVYADHERAKFDEMLSKQRSEQVCKSAEKAEKSDIVKLQIDVNAVNLAK